MKSSALIKKEFILENLNCAHCAQVISERISKTKGVESCDINFATKKMTINTLEGMNLSIDEIKDIVVNVEPDIKVKEINNDKKIEILLEGLNCAHCAGIIEQKVSELEYVNSSNLNFVNKKLTINYSSKQTKDKLVKEVTSIIDKTEPGLSIQVLSQNKINTQSSVTTNKDDINKKYVWKLLIGAIVYIFGIYQLSTGYQSEMDTVIFVSAYLIVGGDVLIKALKNISRGQMFDENFLMTIATIGALIIGELPEAVGVMLFYQVGEYLQAKAVGKSRQSISELMNIKPDSANLKKSDKIEKVSPEEVQVGDTIIVKPGEKVPLDGVVIDGNSMLDTSALTGESVLREVYKGEDVLSGFINKNSLLTIQVTKEFGESTVSKILDLVENASSKKSKTENFITVFSRYYTPIVVILAMMLAIVPPMIIEGAEFSEWIYRGLIFLVVSCPCALVLSIPLSFFSGIGYASKKGILIKGSNYLEALKEVDTVVFDKTGTLTKGVFEVTNIQAEGISKEELIKFAAYAEVNSNHPIAKSITKYYNKDIDINKIESYEEVAAHGIKVKYESDFILAGNEKMMKKENVLYKKSSEVGTIIYIAVNGIFKGSIVIADKIKEESKQAIVELKNNGIKKVVMLTGDNEDVAQNIAKELGITDVYSELLPDQKVEKLELLYEGRNKKEKIIFVGDGINDAPVLARADVGIAMGALGSDAAIEAADVVLMADEIDKIAEAIKISKKTKKIVWQNIIFALGVKLVVLVLGAGGVATMWEAIFADVGVAVIAVLNAMRVMK